MNVRRVLIATSAGMLVAAMAWTAWIAWATQRDLTTARSSVDEIRAAIENEDVGQRDLAIQQLHDSASSAASRTGGTWWGLVTHVPWIGDDAQGVEMLAASIDTLAAEGIEPLAVTAERLGALTSQGRVDVDVLASIGGPIAQASAGAQNAAALLEGAKSENYVSALRIPLEEYAKQLEDLNDALMSAQLATEVAPSMLGSEGARDYLVIFQSNAEIRATGGLPGSWARIHADNGLLTMEEQGSAADFPVLDKPVLPLSQDEEAVYGREIGRYWQDPGFTPDFPRAAQLFNAFWQIDHEDVPLDGIVALDPIALSYLLEGTGPVQAGELTLSADNAAQILLNQVYLDNSDPATQDRQFQIAARSIFEAVTRDIPSPLSFFSAISRASQERRVLVAPFRNSEKAAIEGTDIEGALPIEGDRDPSVFVGLNDATGSKMSFYLRYWASVASIRCQDGVQDLAGKLTMNQTITQGDAAQLPDYITGGGIYGTRPGEQLVLVRIYGPFGGEFSNIRINGVRSKFDDVSELEGRPVATIPVSIESRNDTTVTWEMRTGPDQTGAIRLGVTPSVVPGTLDREIRSSC